MLLNDGNELALDQPDHLLEELRVELLVGVEPVNEHLTSVQGKRLGERDRGNPIVGGLVELKRALVLELGNNPLLDLDDGTVGVDEMVVKDFPQGGQRIIGRFLEGLVATVGGSLVEVGLAGFDLLAHPRCIDLGIVLEGTLPAQKLPLTLSSSSIKSMMM